MCAPQHHQISIQWQPFDYTVSILQNLLKFRSFDDKLDKSILLEPTQTSRAWIDVGPSEIQL